MSEENTPDEVLSLVEAAQSKNVFNITDFAKGRAYPQDTVTVYVDVDSAYELSKINEQIADAGLDETEKIASLEEKAKELADKIVKSRLIFHMRGVNQEIIENITKKCNEVFPPQKNAYGQEESSTEWMQEWTCSLVAANIVKIENADGEFDERVFSSKDVNEFRKYLPREVWELIVDKMQKLTLASAYFKGLTDAGFLPKS